MQCKYISMWIQAQCEQKHNLLRHHIFRYLLMTQIWRRIMGNRIIVSNYGSSLSQLSEPGDSATNANTNTNTNTNTSSPPHRGPIPPHSPPPSPPWIKRSTLVFFAYFGYFQNIKRGKTPPAAALWQGWWQWEGRREIIKLWKPSITFSQSLWEAKELQLN